MKTSVHKEGSKLVVAVEGRLDATNSPAFEAEVKNNLEGVSELDLDLAGVDYLSSAGLRTVLFAQKVMNEQGSMRVLNVRPAIMEVFVVTGFDGILTFV